MCDILLLFFKKRYQVFFENCNIFTNTQGDKGFG